MSATTRDLLAAASDDDVVMVGPHGGFVGRGERARIELPKGLADPDLADRVKDAFSALGPGTLAVGAFPFDREAPTSLLVPREVIRHRPTSASEESGDMAQIGPDGFTLSPSIPHHEWESLVAAAVDAIGSGAFRKVVLARAVEVTANRKIVVADVVRRLHDLYPSCVTFSVDGFVGASPELLVRRSGARVAANPVAGTVARVGDAAADAEAAAGLLSSTKDRAEHQLTVDSVARALGPFCASLDVPPAPEVFSLRNVSHLGTRVDGTLLARGAELPSVLELVAALHPTAAVGGSPTEPALEWLEAHERLERGRYAGPVGWVDDAGDGEWRVGIRSAEIDGAQAILRAGCGIVADSNPAAELIESQLKFQALLAALVRP
ncbi:MAG TPA: isochorismate synthase [Acidimicrobiales bacterium]|nr:isochorismate synthase [Acidimicrobiales bacterium]